MSSLKTMDMMSKPPYLGSEWGENTVRARDFGLKSEVFGYEELIINLEGASKLNQESVIGKLNYLHFIGGEIIVLLHHVKFEDTTFMLRAYSEPCFDNELVCRFSDNGFSPVNMGDYKISNLLIDEGRTLIVIPAKSLNPESEGFKIQLPEKSYAVSRRRTKRYMCQGIEAEIVKRGATIRGELLDFSPEGLRIGFVPGPTLLNEFNLDRLILVNLRKDNQIIFSGLCQCLRRGSGLNWEEIVLSPLASKSPRFRKRKIRNPRQKLVPAPTILFNHPFSNVQCRFEISDISSSGFRVYEQEYERVLMPGMVIPSLEIDFGGALKVRCEAQVIYSIQEEEKGVRCGFAILDMALSDYTTLINILTNAVEPHAYIVTEVDMEDLWKFFFDTGFIYPSKYRHIYNKREELKKTYQKLYQESPDIAKHFTYQKNGRIYGHVSIVRAYARTWMIQHHAARTAGAKRAGLVVLKQIMYYLKDMYRLPSANMDYLMVYFRPNNKFPDRVFGDFARNPENSQQCTMDLFDYFWYEHPAANVSLPEGWNLRRSTDSDLTALKDFYTSHSGGLLLDGFGLRSRDAGDESIEEVYKRQGFKRRFDVYSLSYKDHLAAVLIVSESEQGLNFSELLNSVQIIETSPEDIEEQILFTAVSQLTDKGHMSHIPVLVYPAKENKEESLSQDRQYQIWIYDARFVDQFMEYMQERFKAGFWNS